MLAVIEDGTVIRTFPVSVGASVSPSPSGEFEIVRRVDNPTYYHQKYGRAPDIAIRQRPSIGGNSSRSASIVRCALRRHGKIYRSLAEQVENFERQTIIAELKRNRFHMTHTARALGLERSHLYKKGSAKITGSHADHEHILVAMDAGTYNVVKSTCQVYCLTCDGYWTGWIDPSPVFTTIRSQVQSSLYSFWDDSSQMDLTGFGAWSSGNTNILTVNLGMVTGVSAGTTSLQAYANQPDYVFNDCSEQYWMCPETYGIYGSGTGNVGIPRR